MTDDDLKPGNDLGAGDVRAALDAAADPEAAARLGRFFKTGPGEYGEGDVFLGLRVPQTRAVVRRFRALPLAEARALLNSPVHEHRLAGLLILVDRFGRNPEARGRIVELYLHALRAGRVNNWDLVDASSDHILGRWLVCGSGDRELLDDLAADPDLWRRRAALLATFAFVKQGDPEPTLTTVSKVLDDRRDLIQKAAGWMLREVGKRIDRATLVAFLDSHAAAMGRTALSYATEHLDAEERARLRALR
ncbi:DNA alkylation repair protein [Rhodococcus chondri]|uniref:DNA alkylation repair protein n=1 Tax=Rhodococcus chondri TaxID=3065941 RepID=A0ABU7JTP0_9NOCA|nr:DNA alkylation repair protein [Rhodococcus sp. CC-R104]MEE2033279.1 DNA alkylation repair protein [Rhodococcus sp. CC-R104]